MGEPTTPPNGLERLCGWRGREAKTREKLSTFFTFENGRKGTIGGAEDWMDGPCRWSRGLGIYVEAWRRKKAQMHMYNIYIPKIIRTDMEASTSIMPTWENYCKHPLSPRVQQSPDKDLERVISIFSGIDRSTSRGCPVFFSRANGKQYGMEC